MAECEVKGKVRTKAFHYLRETVAYWVDSASCRPAICLPRPRTLIGSRAIPLSNKGTQRMKRMLLLPMFCAAGFALGQASTAAGPAQDLNQTNEPPRLGIHWARGFEPNTRAAEEAKAASGRASRSPDMTYHGGVIMPSSNTKAIFWGTSWGSYSGDKITGMDSWYQGFSNSNYAK